MAQGLEALEALGALEALEARRDERLKDLEGPKAQMGRPEPGRVWKCQARKPPQTHSGASFFFFFFTWQQGPGYQTGQLLLAPDPYLYAHI